MSLSASSATQGNTHYHLQDPRTVNIFIRHIAECIFRPAPVKKNVKFESVSQDLLDRLIEKADHIKQENGQD